MSAVPTGPAGASVTRPTRLLRLGRSDELAPHPATLAAVLVVAPVLFLGCAVLAGGRVSPWLLVLAPVLLLLVPRAGSHLVLLLWAALGAVWLVQVPGPFSWWALPAAASALFGHLAASLLSGSPTTVTWPASTRRRYLRRSVVVLAVTALVAALVQVVLRARLSGDVALTAAALLGTAVWLWAGRFRDEVAEADAPARPDGSG